jgi:hypothetical protein
MPLKTRGVNLNEKELKMTKFKPVTEKDILNYLLENLTIETSSRGGRFTLTFEGQNWGNPYDEYIYDRIEAISKERELKKEDSERTDMMISFLEEGGDPEELIRKAKSVIREKCVIDADESMIKDEPQPHEHEDAADDPYEQSRGGN